MAARIVVMRASWLGRGRLRFYGPRLGRSAGSALWDTFLAESATALVNANMTGHHSPYGTFGAVILTVQDST